MAAIQRELQDLAEAAEAARRRLAALAAPDGAAPGGEPELLARALEENARAVRMNTLELRALPGALETRLRALAGALTIGD